jgi:uncharacterized protein YcsI (UPF0317 family)
MNVQSPVAPPAKPQDPAEARRLIREGAHTTGTEGLANGYLQGNLVILPAENALDFFRFCQRNPKPCPLVGVSDTGNPDMFTLGTGIDIRSDVPSYNIFRDGVLSESRHDVSDLWDDRSVAFILGCSYTFEEALVGEGIRLRHWEEGHTVSMYRTNIQTTPAGPFRGEMVVSMRPMTMADAIRAAAITSRFPHAHGAPVHIGDPAQIGISDISRPDYGPATRIEPGEVPVFWACGVTPQNTVLDAKLPLVITHTPGHMLITDIPSWDAAPG